MHNIHRPTTTNITIHDHVTWWLNQWYNLIAGREIHDTGHIVMGDDSRIRVDTKKINGVRRDLSTIFCCCEWSQHCNYPVYHHSYSSLIHLPISIYWLGYRTT